MNRKIIIYFGVFVLLCISPDIFSQQDTAKVMKFSLIEAQAYAVQNSYAVRNGQIDLASAKKKVWETTAIGLPQVSANITYQNIFNPIVVDFSAFLPSTAPPGSGIITAAPKDNITYKGTVSQLIFSGEYLVGLKAARTYLNMSEESLKKSEMDTKETVSKTYYQIIITQQVREIIKQNLSIMDKMLNDNKELFKVGMVEETSVDQLQINKTDLDIRLNQIEKGIDVLKKLLKFQMGIDIAQNIEMTDSVNIFVEQALIPVLSVNQELNLDNNIDDKIMKTNEKGSYLLLQRERSKYLPTLAAVYMHQKLKTVSAFNFTPPDVFALSLDIPIFSSGMRISRVGQAKLALVKAQNQREQVEQGLLLDFQQTKSDLVTSYDKMMNLKENVGTSKKIYDKTLFKFNKGMSSSFELTQAESQYLQTEMNYYNSVLELLNLKTKFDKYTNQNF